jgi:propionyl-CoA carboxylase beta chain
MSHDLTTTAGKMADFRSRMAEAAQPSGPEAVEKQHARGKHTARERIGMLLDEGSFVEFDALATHRSTAFGMEKKKPLGDGLVSGYGTVDGRLVAVYSQDFSVYGGSLSQVNGEKIVKVQEFALRNGAPLSASSTAAVPASRRASPHWPCSPTSSGTTFTPPASSRRFR